MLAKLRSVQMLPAIAVAGILIVAALALRLAILPLALGRTAVGDPSSYVEIANNVLAGQGHVRVIPGMIFRAYYPPLYPSILAAVGLFAPLTAPTFLALNFLIDTATAGAMLWAGRLLGISKASAIAAALYLLWPTAIIMSPIAYKEGLSALFAVLLLCFWLQANRSMWFAVGFGAVAGFNALNQPGLALLPAVLAIAVRPHFAASADWAKAIAVGIVAAVIVLLPWWIRNAALLGEFIPLTTASGAAIWVGTTPTGNGVDWVQYPPHLFRGTELQFSHAAASEALAWIQSHPVEYVRHCLSKAPHMLVGDRWFAKPLSWMTPSIQPNLALTLLPQLASIVLFAAAAIGTLLTRRSILATVTLAYVAYLFLFLIWFEFAERHRYFLVPILCLVAVQGMMRKATLGRRHKAVRRGG